MERKTLIKPFVFVAIFLIMNFVTNAQKLPNVQKESLRASKEIKIDGKLADWDKGFQAYNKSTSVFYTISNDDDNLYLAIQAKDPTVITKIILGGITLTIDTSDAKKNEGNNVAITFPIYDKTEQPVYLVVDKQQKGEANVDNAGSNSIMMEHNKKLTGKLKLIGVKGIDEIQDSIISIYNANGIKAAALFDDQLDYSYELALPLRYLGVTAIRPVKLNYNIKLNGAAGSGTNIQSLPGGRGISWTGADGISYRSGGTPADYIITFPTDFSSDYNLIEYLY